MLKAKIIVIAMLSLLMTAVALAQPAQKRTPPQKSAIWGHETNYGVKGTARKPRPKDWSFGASNPTAVGTHRTRRPQPRANTTSTQPTESLSLNMVKGQHQTARRKR